MPAKFYSRPAEEIYITVTEAEHYHAVNEAPTPLGQPHTFLNKRVNKTAKQDN